VHNTYNYKLLSKKKFKLNYVFCFFPKVERKAQLVMRLTIHLVVQSQQLNRSGELFTQKYPILRVQLVDGSGLATIVVLKSIPLGTKQVFLSGCNSKVAYSTAIALCEKGVLVCLSVQYSIQ
jgi:ActR/RegA family two-component response regulator